MHCFVIIIPMVRAKHEA